MFCRKRFRVAAYCVLALEILAVPCIRARAQQVDDPGPAAISASDGGFQLENRVIGATMSIKDRKFSGLVITDHLHGTPIPVPSPFAILFKDGSIWRADDLTTSRQPIVTKTVPLPDASRASDKIAGAEIEIPLESADHSLHVVWSIVLHDGSTYLRQFLEIRAIGQDAPISRVELIDLALLDAHVSGSVEGSPMVAGNLFLGFEHPLSHSKVTGGRATAWIDRDLPLHAGQTIVYSSVIGVAHAGQMRRDFLAYLERERAHPYRTFLHYNSWYDLGYFSPYDQMKALDRVNTFGRETDEKARRQARFVSV